VAWNEKHRTPTACDVDLNAALDAESSARALFDALNSANRYSVLYRVHQAKTPEKRAAKISPATKRNDRVATEVRNGWLLFL
jgi:uncharacterized protein YdeI (YjbR/CyaY-like superfamily)